jgi:hypothetical protein
MTGQPEQACRAASKMLDVRITTDRKPIRISLNLNATLGVTFTLLSLLQDRLDSTLPSVHIANACSKILEKPSCYMCHAPAA